MDINTFSDPAINWGCITTASASNLAHCTNWSADISYENEIKNIVEDKLCDIRGEMHYLLNNLVQEIKELRRRNAELSTMIMTHIGEHKLKNNMINQK